MTNATILSLLCLMMIISNEPPNSTSNNARASSVVTTSTSMNKFDSRDASECDEQPRIRVSNYDHPQMIQLKDLDQTVQEASPSETLTTVSHIFGEVIYSLWYIIPVEIAIGIVASATNCRFARGLAVLVITPVLMPRGAQGLVTNDTEASFLTNDCTGITVQPKMKLFSMENPPQCKKGSTRYEDPQPTKVQIIQLPATTTVPITNCRIEIQFFVGWCGSNTIVNEAHSPCRWTR
jgi:hypothetical protein